MMKTLLRALSVTAAIFLIGMVMTMTIQAQNRRRSRIDSRLSEAFDFIISKLEKVSQLSCCMVMLKIVTCGDR